MSPEPVRAAIRKYAELERQVIHLVTARLTPAACANCDKPCCAGRADICREAVRSWWLRQVSRSVHGKWWPDDWQSRAEPIALTDEGCLLEAGRPLICHWYYCRRFLEPCEDIWELIVYSFVSELPNFALRPSSRVDVTALDAAGVRRRIGVIAARIDDAARLLETAKRLLGPGASAEDRHRTALELICAHPGFLRPIARRALLRKLRTFGRDG